jgi:hypothetical protein
MGNMPRITCSVTILCIFNLETCYPKFSVSNIYGTPICKKQLRYENLSTEGIKKTEGLYITSVLVLTMA